MGSNESKPSNNEKRQIEESTTTTHHTNTTQEEYNTDHHHDRRGILFHRRGHSKDVSKNRPETQPSATPSSATPPLPPPPASSSKAAATTASIIARAQSDSPTSLINVSGRRSSLKKPRHSTNLFTMIKHPHASMRKSFSSGSESGDSTDTNKTSDSSGGRFIGVSTSNFELDSAGSAAMISAVANAMAASTPSMGSRTASNGEGNSIAPQTISTSNEPASNSKKKGNKSNMQKDYNEQWPIKNASTSLHAHESEVISEGKKQKFQPAYESQTNDASERLLKDLYLLPESDSLRRKERDRQQRQHYLLKYVWRANFKVPLQSPTLIVNWCCGTGIWAMEMAQQFPNCQVVGMDFQSATLSNLGRSIKNLSFQNIIMQHDKTGLETLEEDTVDYLMMRDVWLVNSPDHKWFETLTEVFRVLKPGGWVEIYEQDLGVHSPGPYMRITDRWYGNLFKGVGISRSFHDELGSMMDKVGYIKIDERAIELPVGEWSTVPALKETGYLFKDLMTRRFRTFAPWLSKFSDMSLGEVNHVLDKAIVECEEYKTSMCWRYFAAQKPPQEETKAGLSD